MRICFCQTRNLIEWGLIDGLKELNDEVNGSGGINVMNVKGQAVGLTAVAGEPPCHHRHLASSPIFMSVSAQGKKN